MFQETGEWHPDGRWRKVWWLRKISAGIICPSTKLQPASRRRRTLTSPRHIAEATGERGSSQDYLAQTVEKLRALRINDPDLEALLDAVMELGAKPESGCSTAAR